MNNERYLFRGMTWEGKWVYGIPTYLIQENCDEGIYDGIRTSWEENEDVRPETIGQFTGLTDKNGVKIFSGDKVKNGFSGTWIVQTLERGSFSLLGICKQYEGSNFDIAALNQNVEVIGTIHTIN